MYPKTAVGKIEVKEIPRRIALESSTEAFYFRGNNNLFRTLFRYIKRNEVAMTLPVEAEIRPGKMRFFVGRKDQAKQLKPDAGVEVKNIARLTVASIGVRGSYSEERFQRYEQKLLAWLAKHPEYEAISPPYAVYWSSPLIPGLFKRSEIHVNLKKKTVQEKKLPSTSGDPDKPDES